MKLSDRIYATADARDYWGTGWERIELRAFRTVRRGVRCIRFRWECRGCAARDLPGVFKDCEHAIRYAEAAENLLKKIRRLEITNTGFNRTFNEINQELR